MGLAHHNFRKREHRDLGSATTDVHDHVPRRPADWQLCTDRCRHWLFNEERLPCTSLTCSVEHVALLNRRGAGGNAHEHIGSTERESPRRTLLDEVAKHRLGDNVVGNHTVAEWSNCGNGARRSPEHLLRLITNGDDLVAIVDGNNARLTNGDAAPLHEDENVCGS